MSSFSLDKSRSSVQLSESDSKMQLSNNVKTLCSRVQTMLRQRRRKQKRSLQIVSLFMFNSKKALTNTRPSLVCTFQPQTRTCYVAGHLGRRVSLLLISLSPNEKNKTSTNTVMIGLPCSVRKPLPAVLASQTQRLLGPVHHDHSQDSSCTPSSRRPSRVSHTQPSPRAFARRTPPQKKPKKE